MCKKKLHKGFCGWRRSWARSDERLQAMSLESGPVGSDDYKFEKWKKKKEKSCVVRQLQSCHIVQTIRAAQWGKKRACQPPTCNSESEMLGISEDCDISHLAEWVKDTITKPPPAPQKKDSLYIFQSAQVVNWFPVCVTKTTRAGRLCYQQQT